jgi:hypothetical protein
MSLTTQLWKNAEEAMLDAQRSKNAAEKQALLDLARAWTRAALRSEGHEIIAAPQNKAKAA